MLRDPGEVGKTAQERRILKVLPRITSLSSVILERSAKQPKRGKPSRFCLGLRRDAP
jgi:hypothetical protein